MSERKLDKPIEKCPEANASIISRITYSWLSKIMSYGYQRPLQPEDMYELGSSYLTETLSEKFKESWSLELKKAKPSLSAAMSRTFGPVFYPAGILKFVGDIAQMTAPIVQNYLIDSVGRAYGDGSYPQYMPYVYCLVLFAINMVATVMVNTYFQITMLTGFQVRTALTAVIYEKSLTLSNVARQKFSTGQIVNMMATDAGRLDSLAGYFHYLWSGPLQIVCIVSLLCFLIGPSALTGFGLLILLLPIQGKLMSILGRMRKKTNIVADQRVKVLQEIFNGIRVIKFYAWENSFLSRVMEMRSREINYIKNLAYARAGINAIISVVPVFASIISFATYAALGNELEAASTFSALTFFGLLRIPLILLPMVISQFVDAKVAVNRIESYLMGEEIKFRAKVDVGSEFAIQVNDCDFKWETIEDDEDKREGKESKGKKKESKSSKEGSKKEDSKKESADGKKETTENKESTENKENNENKEKDGKSSLLGGLLGEMTCTKGEVIFGGSVGYCPQQAWIQNATLKNNVLFGQEYNEEKYKECLHYCALEKDLEILPDGDETEIGEKGINLSGGQKQRVSLARAVYFGADIIFLDDPLSAVDAHVGRFLFEKCIKGVLSDKTRILVTHQLYFLPECDYIIFMKGGRIQEQGIENVNKVDKINKKDDLIESKKPKALMSVEERAIGAVAWSVYLEYFKSCGGYIFLFLVVFFTLTTQGVKIGNDLWLSVKTSGYFKISLLNWIGIYFAFGVAQLLFTIAFGLVFSLGGLISAKTLFERSLKNVLLCPMSFFDTTPIGRIINRFSKDQDAVDNQLADSFRMFLFTLSSCIATFILIIVFTPFFIIPLIPLLLFYYFVQIYYRSTSRELKRLDSISRSPLYAHFSETLTGISTIRAYKEESRFSKVNKSFTDFNNRPIFLQILAQRWLSLRLESIGNLLVLGASMLLVFSKINLSLLGLALSYILSVTGFLNWCVRQASDAEVQMNSVERLSHYANDIKTEAPAVIHDNRPPADWPLEGKIDIQNLEMRYRPELPPVLHQISISIKSKEKIGVVGRTGAGKSSIMIALFRLVEPTS
ncbi:hypothetical protein ROZALSC1DRAFT_30847, partial [Rozella allomycis CSF55]